MRLVIELIMILFLAMHAFKNVVRGIRLQI